VVDWGQSVELKEREGTQFMNDNNIAGSDEWRRDNTEVTRRAD
jgi:hypothetical protein